MAAFACSTLSLPANVRRGLKARTLQLILPGVSVTKLKIFMTLTPGRRHLQTSFHRQQAAAAAAAAVEG